MDGCGVGHRWHRRPDVPGLVRLRRDPCSVKWGEQYGYAVMPDEVFWQEVNHEMLEKYGRPLTAVELQNHVESGDCNSLSLLLKEAPSTH